MVFGQIYMHNIHLVRLDHLLATKRGYHSAWLQDTGRQRWCFWCSKFFEAFDIGQPLFRMAPAAPGTRGRGNDSPHRWQNRASCQMKRRNNTKQHETSETLKIVVKHVGELWRAERWRRSSSWSMTISQAHQRCPHLPALGALVLRKPCHYGPHSNCWQIASINCLVHSEFLILS
jgi:hypothetical protein